MILSRQTTPYSCGPAALIAAAQIQGRSAPDIDALTLELNPDPVCGLDNDVLAAAAAKYLDLDAQTEGWHGGLALANIRNPDSGVGHFVVMLSEDDGHVRYYCPLHGAEVRIARDRLVWTNGDGTVHDWVINLKHHEDDLYVGRSFVFILGDDKSTLQAETDTSLLIESAYREAGRPVFWVRDNEISVIGSRLYMGGMPVGKNDLVWIRLDPVNTVRYYETLRLLAGVEGVNFVNSPAAILLRHDKHTACNYRAKTMTVSVSSHAEVRRALKHLDWGFDTRLGYVVKAPSAFDGAHIRRAATHDEVIAVFDDLVGHSGYVIVEAFVESRSKKPVDTRVFIANGEIIGAVDRIAMDGEWLCNAKSGASTGKTVKIPQLALMGARNLKAQGVFCAGLDFFNGELTEVNITCPSALTMINAVNGVRSELNLIRQADRWVGESVEHTILHYPSVSG